MFSDNYLFKLQFDLKEEINTLDVTALKSDWQVDSLLSTEGGTLILRIEFSPKEVHGKWKLNVDNCDVKTSILNGTLTTNVLKLVLEFPPSQTDNHFQVSFNLVLCGSETCDLKNTVLSVVLKREKTAGMAAECSVIKNLVGN